MQTYTAAKYTFSWCICAKGDNERCGRCHRLYRTTYFLCVFLSMCSRQTHRQPGRRPVFKYIVSVCERRTGKLIWKIRFYGTWRHICWRFGGTQPIFKVPSVYLRWRQQALQKRRLVFVNLHGLISQNTWRFYHDHCKSCEAELLRLAWIFHLTLSCLQPKFEFPERSHAE